jgi:hypothetical protein
MLTAKYLSREVAGRIARPFLVTACFLPSFPFLSLLFFPSISPNPSFYYFFPAFQDRGRLFLPLTWTPRPSNFLEPLWRGVPWVLPTFELQIGPCKKPLFRQWSGSGAGRWVTDPIGLASRLTFNCLILAVFFLLLHPYRPYSFHPSHQLSSSSSCPVSGTHPPTCISRT